MKKILINTNLKRLPLMQIIIKIIKRTINEFFWLYQDIKSEIFYKNFTKVKNYKSKMNKFFITNLTALKMEAIKKLGSDKKIIIKADKICLNNFDILGLGFHQLGNKINWSTDYISNYIWSKKFHKRIKTINYHNDADVKIPWELSRFHFGIVLGQAYLISNNRKYYDKFKNLVIEWIKDNDFNKTVNWTCSMEVAIRACNLIVAIGYFENIIDEYFYDVINNSLFLHGKHIFNNLEKKVISNNHYLSNLVGLIWLGIYFSKCNISSEPKEWLEYGINELEKEILVQIYADGSLYEGSTYYHCFVTEMLLFTYIMCEKNGFELSENFKSRLIKMNEIIMNITKPNGLIPIIGDMDNGRFLIFSNYGDSEKKNFKFLIRLAGEYFNREDFRYNSDDLSTLIWLKVNINKYKPNKVELKSVSYPFGGWHILRNEKIYIIINCRNSNIKGSGGHIHNDQLSLEINLMGYDFIIDPGTYVYTADIKMRNFFRSSNQHNSVIIENSDQMDIDYYKVFNSIDKTEPRVIEFNNNYFKGCHKAYKHKFGCEICREVNLNKNSIVITDKIISKVFNDSYKSISFIFDDMITFSNGKALLPNGNYIKLVSSNQSKKYSDIGNTFLSKKYGQKFTTTKLEYIFNENLNKIEIEFQ